MAEENKQQLVEEKPTKPASEEKISAPTLYNQLLKDNNLVVKLSRPEIKHVDGGGLLIEPSQLIVYYAGNEN